jgi:hypothetical protein
MKKIKYYEIFFKLFLKDKKFLAFIRDSHLKELEKKIQFYLEASKLNKTCPCIKILLFKLKSSELLAELINCSFCENFENIKQRIKFVVIGL